MSSSKTPFGRLAGRPKINRAKLRALYMAIRALWLSFSRAPCGCLARRPKINRAILEALYTAIRAI